MTTILQAATSTTGAVLDPSAGDGQLVIKTGATAGAQVNALSFAADGTPTFLKVPVNTAVQSMIRLNTAAGYGSGSTRVRRFTNVITNQGSDITYTTSADTTVLGSVFTINTAGVYSLQYNDQFTGLTNMGWSLNSTGLSTSILALTITEILCIQDTVGPNNIGNAAWTGYLPAGSVLRCQTSGAATGTNVNGCQVTITRVA